jgi:hypothetical protein
MAKVLNDSVMYDGNFFIGIEMRMGVRFTWDAVRSPSRVSDADVPDALVPLKLID